MKKPIPYSVVLAAGALFFLAVFVLLTYFCSSPQVESAVVTDVSGPCHGHCTPSGFTDDDLTRIRSDDTVCVEAFDRVIYNHPNQQIRDQLIRWIHTGTVQYAVNFHESPPGRIGTQLTSDVVKLVASCYGYFDTDDYNVEFVREFVHVCEAVHQIERGEDPSIRSNWLRGNMQADMVVCQYILWSGTGTRENRARCESYFEQDYIDQQDLFDAFEELMLTLNRPDLADEIEQNYEILKGRSISDILADVDCPELRGAFH